MRLKFRSPRAYGVLLRRRMAQLTTGGAGSETLPAGVRYNLRWFWFDGLFASASDNILLTYLSLYILALGANAAQIGLMSSLSNLSAALLLLPGAILVERWGQRKQITMWAGGGVARFSLLLLMLAPFVFRGPALIYVAIGLSVARAAFSNLALPAWTSLTADMVPLSWRGRYFSIRNIAMGIAGMAVTLLIGEMITRLGGGTGYPAAIGLAFAIGMLSTYSFARLDEAKMEAPQIQIRQSLAPAALLRSIRATPGFVALSLTAALWNFSLNIAGPFFNLFLVEDLKATATMVALVAIASSFAGLPGQRVMGVLTDRWGSRKVQLVTGLLIPILPLVWAFIRAPWQAIPINLVGGFLWAGYSLASFNYLLAITPQEQRARFSALYQIVVTVALAGGAALGGVIAVHWGYQGAFLFSAIGRILAAIAFARYVKVEAS